MNSFIPICIFLSQGSSPVSRNSTPVSSGSESGSEAGNFSMTWSPDPTPTDEVDSRSSSLILTRLSQMESSKIDQMVSIISACLYENFQINFFYKL